MLFFLAISLLLNQVTVAADYHHESDLLSKRDNLPKSPDDTIVCRQEPLELGIVLDSSRSIRKTDFNICIDFLKDYLEEFDISKDNVRVAIILYGDGLYTQDAFNLTTFNTKEDVISAIGRINQVEGGQTKTDMGINYMREVQLNAAVVRPGVTRIGLVITDGDSFNKTATAEEAKAARKSGIQMFAVGVGSQVGQTELRNIAGDMSRVSKVDNYGQLKNLIKSLANRTCIKIDTNTTPQPTSKATSPTTSKTTPQTRTTRSTRTTTTTISPNHQGDEPNCQQNPTDIYFVFSPADLGIDNTIWTTDFISSTVSTEYVRTLFKYGVISGSCPDDEGFNLGSYTTEVEIRNRLKSYGISKLPALTKQLATSGYTTERGARSHARKVAVLVVGGKKSAELVSKQVKTLLDQGIEVFIADPTNYGVKIEGATTLKGQSLAQAEELIYYLCNPCQPTTSK
ncbi:cartilage matrix protein-like [Biomphalaria glabrata]|uniref:Cartilage matrix protein-like n=1 Tax=Biomphalaria glabrata TaxID=6526 RepID=A0A9W2YKR2_BIOGL|nr:cartilage matrix protein-like [Biomphalaria glabrata]